MFRIINIVVYLIFGIVFNILLFAQDQELLDHKSIHQIESEYYKDKIIETTTLSKSNIVQLKKKPFSLNKKVFGWHPYWAASNDYLNYDYDVLYAIGYFSYEVNPDNGGYTTIRNWLSTPIIAYAHVKGVKVMLTVTNFGSAQNEKILSDPIKQQTLINNLVNLLKQAGGDGINIDFESVPAVRRFELVTFMRNLSNAVKAVLPNAEISMATPAVDWSNAWDFFQLGQICDYLIIMGYDYYYSTSSTAGPISPLEGENYNITRSVNNYLTAGVPQQKLFLGLPWYGFDWPVVDTIRKSKTTGTGSSGFYKNLEPQSLLYGKKFDITTKSVWYNYFSGGKFHQVWYEDSLSLTYKYNLINGKNLGGLGIWALSYDGGRKEIWNGIKQYFTQTEVKEIVLPREFVLYQNYPNPFNPSTIISYSVGMNNNSSVLVSVPVTVQIKIYDILGREVATLVDEEKPAGLYSVVFDGSKLVAGEYYYKLKVNDFIETKKMILVK